MSDTDEIPRLSLGPDRRDHHDQMHDEEPEMTGQQEMFPQLNGFSGKRTAEIVGITYRQLDYWARTDLLHPSVAEATGSGSRRSYSYQDLLELKVIKNLLDAGIQLKLVREVFTFLRDQLEEDIATANLVISGNRSVLVRSGDEMIDLVRKGQGVLNILPLGGVKDELDADIRQLFPDAPGAESELRSETGS